MTQNLRNSLTTTVLVLVVVVMSATGVRSIGFLNNDSDADVYVKSVAIDGKITGNSVSLSLRNFEPYLPHKGRRKRGEDDGGGGGGSGGPGPVTGTKAVPAKVDSKPQKDEPEEGQLTYCSLPISISEPRRCSSVGSASVKGPSLVQLLLMWV